MGRAFLLGAMEMFWNRIMVMVTQLCEYAKKHWIEYFKMMNFILCDIWCELYLYKMWAVLTFIIIYIILHIEKKNTLTC